MRSLPFTVDRVAMRVAAKHADDIRNGLRSSINISQIVDSFLATYPDGVVTRAQARDWARLNVVTNNVRLGRALESLYASGWVLGTDYGSEAMRLAAIKKAPTFTIDWSKWKPGQPAAEALVRPPRGLRRLLAKFRNQTIKGISDTNLDRIGTVLADGLAVGADSRSVARELMELGIRGIVDDARRALTIAITETSRAVGAATLERYQEMGLRRFEWITVEGEGVCEACDENAEAGPIPVGEAFPSGDYHEPAHPNCRCKMAPFIEGFSTPVREMAELGATADVVKYDDNQPRDEAGRFSSGAYSLPYDSRISPNNLVSANFPFVGLSDKARDAASRVQNVTKVSEYFDNRGVEITNHSSIYTSNEGKNYEFVSEIKAFPNGEVYGLVEAFENGDKAAFLQYASLSGENSELAVIGQVTTFSAHREMGIATGMLEFARGISPIPVLHSTDLTDEGSGFAASVKFIDGSFIAKYDEDQPRDERGRFSTEAGGDTLDQSEAIDKIWTDGLAAALGRDPDKVSVYKEEQGKELKAVVTNSIAKEMREFDARRIAEISLQGPDSKQLVDIALKSSEGVVGLENMNFVQMTDRGNFNVVTGMSLLYNANDENYDKMTTDEALSQLESSRYSRDGYRLAGTPEAEEMVRHAAVSGLIAQWARTSNNGNPISLALQEVAAQTFGIQNHAGWDNLTGATLQQTDQMVAKNGDVLSSFLNAQYSATQDYLKSAGIKSIELFRGMNVSPEVYAEIRANDNGVHELSTRPLTSWSTNDATAMRFGEPPRGVFLQATIPADRIFSLPLTGVGCLNEEEVVVLGGRDNVIASRVGGLNSDN